MGCIKPPDEVSEPTPRSSSRLAFPRSQWEPAGSLPPDVGVIIDENGDTHTVSFKVGKEGGQRDGHTLIADGDLSDNAAAFDSHHNHYGPDSRDPGTHFSQDRGAYSGPDH